MRLYDYQDLQAELTASDRGLQVTACAQCLVSANLYAYFPASGRLCLCK